MIGPHYTSDQKRKHIARLLDESILPDTCVLIIGEAAARYSNQRLDGLIVELEEDEEG